MITIGVILGVVVVIALVSKAVKHEVNQIVSIMEGKPLDKQRKAHPEVPEEVI